MYESRFEGWEMIRECYEPAIKTGLVFIYRKIEGREFLGVGIIRPKRKIYWLDYIWSKKIGLEAFNKERDALERLAKLERQLELEISFGTACIPSSPARSEIYAAAPEQA